MKRLMSGALLLGAVAVAASCSNVTGDLAGGPTLVTVDHNPIEFKKGTIADVVVQNYDDQGSPLLSDASIVSQSGVVTVRKDTVFQHGAPHYGTQFNVTGDQFGTGLATFSDAGIQTPVDTFLVFPTDSNPIATLSNAAPAIGDTITLTLTEPTFRFDPAVDTIATIGPDSLLSSLPIVAISTDSLVATLVVTAPQTPINTPITVNGVRMVYFPADPTRSRLTATGFQIQSSVNLVLP